MAGLTQQIFNKVGQIEVKVDYAVKQIDKHTDAIDLLNEKQGCYVTKNECKECKTETKEERAEEEKRKENQSGRRQSDKVAWRALKAVIVFNCISITITIVFFVLNYFKN